MKIAKTLLLGIAVLALYFALFYYEKTLLALSAQGKWNFVIPVGIAFIFSFVHGIFTSEFWDAVGLKSKK